MQAIAEVDGGVVDGLTCGLGPQVQGVAGAAAFEAMKVVLVQVGREAPARAMGRAVQGAGAALLGAVGAARLEAKQAEDGGHGDGGANGGEVHGGALTDSRLTRPALVLGLA